MTKIIEAVSEYMSKEKREEFAAFVQTRIGRDAATDFRGRPLAETEFRRELLRLHADAGGECDRCQVGYVREPEDWPCDTLRALAAIWKDHIHFNPDWAKP